MDKEDITTKDIVPVYFSPYPYFQVFKERLDMRRYGACKKPTGGMVFASGGGRLMLRNIVPCSSVAKIPAWRTRISGAWLHKVGETPVKTEGEVVTALAALSANGETHCTLMFLDTEVSHALTNSGIP